MRLRGVIRAGFGFLVLPDSISNFRILFRFFHHRPGALSNGEFPADGRKKVSVVRRFECLRICGKCRARFAPLMFGEDVFSGSRPKAATLVAAPVQWGFARASTHYVRLRGGSCAANAAYAASGLPCNTSSPRFAPLTFNRAKRGIVQCESERQVLHPIGASYGLAPILANIRIDN